MNKLRSTATVSIPSTPAKTSGKSQLDPLLPDETLDYEEQQYIINQLNEELNIVMDDYYQDQRGNTMTTVLEIKYLDELSERVTQAKCYIDEKGTLHEFQSDAMKAEIFRDFLKVVEDNYPKSKDLSHMQVWLLLLREGNEFNKMVQAWDSAVQWVEDRL